MYFCSLASSLSCLSSRLGYRTSQNPNGTKGTRESKDGSYPVSHPNVTWKSHVEEYRDDMGHKWSLDEMFKVFIIMTIFLAI